MDQLRDRLDTGSNARASSVVDSLLGPLIECLDAESARRVVEFKISLDGVVAFTLL